MLLEQIFTIEIDTYAEPGLPDQVRIQFNSDDGQFFYIRDGAKAELLRERIARMCLSAFVDEHWHLEGPWKGSDGSHVKVENTSEKPVKIDIHTTVPTQADALKIITWLKEAGFTGTIQEQRERRAAQQEQPNNLSPPEDPPAQNRSGS
jgi:hypothetical protein